MEKTKSEMQHKPITTEEENRVALARLWEIFDSEPGTPEGDEAEILTNLIAKFEEEFYSDT